MSVTRKVVLVGMLSALGVIIAPYFWFPVLASKAYPGQHMLNAIAGVLLGPWWAALVAIIVGVIRNLLGIGTIYAFPGGIPGAVVVGLFASLLKKTKGGRWVELAALTEPIGTVLIGATISVIIFAPMLGHAKMAWALLPVWFSWSLSSIPGCILGYLILLALKRIGIDWRSI